MCLQWAAEANAAESPPGRLRVLFAGPPYPTCAGSVSVPQICTTVFFCSSSTSRGPAVMLGLDRELRETLLRSSSNGPGSGRGSGRRVDDLAAHDQAFLSRLRNMCTPFTPQTTGSLVSSSCFEAPIFSLWHPVIISRIFLACK